MSDDDDVVPLKGPKQPSTTEEKNHFAAFNLKCKKKLSPEQRLPLLGKDRRKKQSEMQTRTKLKSAVKRSTAHVPARVKLARQTAFDSQLRSLRQQIETGTLTSAELSTGSSGPEGSASLVEWLRSARNSYNGGDLSVEQEEQLNSLREIGFDWLQATFKAARFRKAIATRISWTAPRLADNAWVLEMQQLERSGRVPQWAAAELQQLLDHAPLG